MKRLFALLLTAVMLLALAGCSGNGNGATADSEAPEAPDNAMVGIWQSAVDGAVYYYDFRNGGALSVYVDSYTLDVCYTAKDGDDGTAFSLLLPTEEFGNIGALLAGEDGTFTVSEGSYDKHDRIGELKYDDDEVFTFTEVDKAGPTYAKIPENYQVDKKLLDTWVNNYSTDEARQTITFNDDGTLQMNESYNYNDVTLGIRRDCTYTADNGMLTLFYVMDEEQSMPVEYTVDGDSLNFGGMYFTREGVEIPTEAVEEKTTEAAEEKATEAD